MARAKRQSTKKTENKKLEQALTLNGLAISEGPSKKSWSLKDLKLVTPKTRGQEEVFREWHEGQHICMHGTAGTGKTYIGLYMALEAVLRQNQNRIIIVRSSAQTRQQGFLPGDKNEKMEVFEGPYQDICHDLIGKSSTYGDMIKARKIEFMSTSFIRGLTWDNAVVIVDESQNMTAHELNSVMTRVGENTRVIVCGDVVQSDLTGRQGDVSGMEHFLRVILEMRNFSQIQFTVNDVVRSGFVKSWIQALEIVPK